VPDKTNVQLFTFFSDGEIRFAIYARLRFDEINAVARGAIDGSARFGCGFHDDGRLVGGRLTIEIWPSEKNLRARTKAARDFNAQSSQILDVPAHVANGGDAVGEEQRKNKLPAARGLAGAREVNVHVGQAGYEEFPGSIESLRAVRNRQRARWAERSDAVADDEQRYVLLRCGASRIDYGDISDRYGWFTRSGTRREKTTNGQQQSCCKREHPFHTASLMDLAGCIS
jgi:hypothetical protein